MTRESKQRDKALSIASIAFVAVAAIAMIMTAIMPPPSENLQNSGAANSAPANTNIAWPPQLGNKYPPIELMSVSGKKVRLADYAGKVLLIEPIGMNCPACLAFAGADERGGFQGNSPQGGLPSIESMLKREGVAPDDKRLVRVQLLLYSPSMKAPTLEEVQAWSKHFGFGTGANQLLLFGDASYINNASYNMIPGFQLVDKDFVLCCDATGHNPKNDLYRELLPMVKKLIP